MCATLVYYRTPTKETHPRATRKNSSSHRISLVQEGLNLPTDNFPLNTAGKNGRPLVTIRPLLSLFIYLSSSVSLSFFDPNGLFRESMTRESDLKTRVFHLATRFLKVYFLSIFCCLEEDDGSNIFLSIFLNFNLWFIDTKFLIRSSKSKIIFFVGKI